jgi:hypothetical protein
MDSCGQNLMLITYSEWADNPFIQVDMLSAQAFLD